LVGVSSLRIIDEAFDNGDSQTIFKTDVGRQASKKKTIETSKTNLKKVLLFKVNSQLCNILY
jgi:hypothetical protein